MIKRTPDSAPQIQQISGHRAHVVVVGFCENFDFKKLSFGAINNGPVSETTDYDLFSNKHEIVNGKRGYL